MEAITVPIRVITPDLHVQIPNHAWFTLIIDLFYYLIVYCVSESTESELMTSIGQGCAVRSVASDQVNILIQFTALCVTWSHR